MKKIIALFLVILVSAVLNVSAYDNIEETANYLRNTVTNPEVGTVGGEWTVIGLARGGADITDEYFSNYYENVKRYTELKKGILHSRKYTEYSRVVLALTSIGKNPEDVSGYNLVLPIMDFEKTTFQGVNGAIWALIALDSGGYGTDEIRGRYIEYILKSEKINGGWAISQESESADVDVTAMALIALKKYKDLPNVNSAIERAISFLSEIQNENGGYSLYGIETSESAAQVLAALSTLGIPYSDLRFIKNGKSLIDNIMSYKNSDGSFSHTDRSDLMATEQCYYALVSAERLKENKNPVFDMSDVNAGAVFYDIIGHKNQKAIESLFEMGIINGMEKGVFAPDNNMTRAEFATIIVKALGVETGGSSDFVDVNENDWFYDYVNTAYNYGIVKGVSEKEFNPGGMITREQAAVMIARASKICGIDTDISTDEINSHNVAIRAEIAQMVYDMLMISK